MRIHSESPENIPLIKEAVNLLRKTTEEIELSVFPFEKKKDISDDILSELISLRLTNPADRDARAFNSFALRDFERRSLQGEARARGVPYEGVGLMKLYRKLINKGESLYPELNVVVTDKLTMTWSEDDLRYHARVIVFGVPCVISMSGLVEAPARPREYYLARQAIESIGGSAEASLAKQFEGRFLEPDDKRTSEVLRGYLLQCIFYGMTGDPFCDDPDCMLYNAHWQEEMLHAQVEHGRLCNYHADQLERH